VTPFRATNDFRLHSCPAEPPNKCYYEIVFLADCHGARERYANFIVRLESRFSWRIHKCIPTLFLSLCFPNVTSQTLASATKRAVFFGNLSPADLMASCVASEIRKSSLGSYSYGFSQQLFAWRHRCAVLVAVTKPSRLRRSRRYNDYKEAEEKKRRRKLSRNKAVVDGIREKARMEEAWKIVAWPNWKSIARMYILKLDLRPKGLEFRRPRTAARCLNKANRWFCRTTVPMCVLWWHSPCEGRGGPRGQFQDNQRRGWKPFRHPRRTSPALYAQC